MSQPPIPLLPVHLEQGYAQAVPELSLAWRAAPAPDPTLQVLNDDLAVEVGLDPAWLAGPDGLEFLLGQVPQSVPTVAQVYAGHQFGGYSPRLGDGRALLLGELLDTDGQRRDLHLKGSGRTPFARGGDGKAVLGPMLREYLMGEAMHALGIPTTRALSVVATGERVMREEGYLPGAVLCRVAASHLRVGTFQFAAANGGPDLVRRLADYAIARHYPAITTDAHGPDNLGDPGNPYLALLEAVAGAQAQLLAQWMSVGFIHGVMNTDNMTISGQTIDYGPCAFLDAYDPATVFSSIDHGGRYAYGNQPGIAQWNLARFAETLLPLLHPDPDTAVDRATDALSGFARRYDAAVTAILAAKLGLPEPESAAESESDADAVAAAGAVQPRALIADCLELLREQRVDFTGFFRALAAGTARDLFAEPTAFDAWAQRRAAMVVGEPVEVAAAMNRINPAYIPRNHRVEEALAAATDGDLALFERLLSAVRRPFDERADLADLAEPAPDDAPAHVTFCGT
ncbi:uncharacterized protein YdiU (UPF0061 family) [Kineosphaera limosa]|nr:YdiU family protein [Kineosphaera limosa]NYE01277.1 uncharacterized protein YdiU (UPF0061 family) [Kineosphaera limosa]